SPTFGSSIHPHLGEVSRGRQSITSSNIIPFIISSKGPKYPTNTRVQKDMSNEFGIYRKHMQNNKSYICLNKII
ncbi:hypothetical protein GW17_00018392, partial [Ensete ventricosum]